MKEPIMVDFSKVNEFTACGKVYRVSSTLAITRYCDFQVLQTELGLGMTLPKLFEKLATLRMVLNQARFVDAAVLVNDISSNCTKLSEKEPTVMKICALFLNTEDEDITKFSNDLLVQKMKDWKEAGISFESFFQLAFSIVPGYIALYNQLAQTITEHLKPLQKMDA